MPAPFFTTNPSEFERLEGLYIFERNPPGFVRGVSLSTVAIYGTTLKGPALTPVTITSGKRFEAIFGSDRHAAGGGPIVSEVWKALLNKPFGTLVISRAVALDAVVASFTAEDTAGGAGTEIVRIDAAAGDQTSVGVWGNDVAFRVTDASDGDANHWNLDIRYKGEIVTYENLNTQAGFDNLADVIGDDLAVNVLVTKLADGRPVNNAGSVDGADAEGFTNLGTVVAGFTSVAGSDGTITAADHISAFDTVKEFKGVSVVVSANEDDIITPTLNAQVLIGALGSSDRMFVIHEGSLTGADVNVANIVLDAPNYPSDRIIYAHNAPFTTDPGTGNQVQTSPAPWMASILSQIDVDIHPGEEDTKQFTGGITKLDDETLVRADYIALRDAGVCSLERDQDGGFLFVSGVTTSLVPGRKEITRRRSADLIQISLANRLRFFVKKKNTSALRAQIGGEAEAFLLGLKNASRVVELFEVRQDVTSEDERARGLEKVLVRVKLIGHALFLVLETEIGTGVVIEVAA